MSKGQQKLGYGLQPRHLYFLITLSLLNNQVTIKTEQCCNSEGLKEEA